MPTTAVSVSNPWAGSFGTNASVATWTGVINGNDGAPAGAAGYSDKTVQVSGTFGAGGTIIVEGTVNGTTWFQLTDPTGTVISFTSTGGKAITEAVGFVRVRVTGGDGSTAINASILMVSHEK